MSAAVKHQPATPLPCDVAQKVRAGRGWLIVRNSATLASTDYEHVADQIVDALNKRHAYSKLVEALRVLNDICDNVPIFQLDGGKASVKAVRLAGKFTAATKTASALLRDLGEEE